MTRPSNKFILIIGATVFAILLLVIATNYRNKPFLDKKEAKVAVKDGVTIVEIIEELDQDNDGLKDWEEVLWNTDPSKADTDKDGTTDGEEVKLGRNPTKAGPNDKFSTTTLNVSEKSGQTTTPETMTDTISKDLFTKYVALRLSGAEMTDEDHQLLVENVMQGSNSKITITEYKYTDLNIAFKETEESLRAYAENMGTIIQNNPIYDDELTILKQYLDSVENDDPKPEILKRLDNVIAINDIILKQMSELEVPPALALWHLQILNSGRYIQSAISGLKIIETDSVLAMDRMNSYLTHTNQFIDALSAIAKFYDTHQLTFEEGTPGYSFTHLYQ